MDGSKGSTRAKPSGRDGLSRVTAKPMTMTVDVELVLDIGKEEVWKLYRLPFLPTIDDELAVGPHGDFMTVGAVYWGADVGVTVWFKGDDKRVLATFLNDGWERWESFRTKSRTPESLALRRLPGGIDSRRRWRPKPPWRSRAADPAPR